MPIDDVSFNEIQDVSREPHFVPRPNPLEIPAPGIFDEPLVCLNINAEWAAHFRGVIDALDQPDTWITNIEHDVEWARQQIREALVRFGEMCMPDPCCPETNTLLTQVVTNQTEIINQNTTTIFNQYSQSFQDFITNNTYQQTYNNQMYDGTPQSIAPSAGDDFSDGTSDGDAKLCAAIKNFIAQQIYTYGMQANLIYGAAGITSALILGLGAAFSVFTAGASLIAGAAISSLILASSTLWNNIINDQSAQQKVRCCMFDALKDQPLTEENFQNCFNGCGFDAGSNEAYLAQQLANSVSYFHDDYLAFLRFYQAASGAGGIGDCDCCNDISDYELIAVNDCIVTKIDDFHYHIEQTNFVYNDETHTYKVFTATIKERDGRCFDIVSGSGGGQHDYLQTDCAGIEHSGTGGWGGEMILGTTHQWVDPITQPDTTLDMIVEIACPS